MFVISEASLDWKDVHFLEFMIGAGTLCLIGNGKRINFG